VLENKCEFVVFVLPVQSVADTIYIENSD